MRAAMLLGRQRLAAGPVSTMIGTTGSGATRILKRGAVSIGHPQGRLVVVGTGWGAMSLLREIDTTGYEVVVISPRNHFVFTPLLAGSAVGTLEHRCVMEPVRGLRRNVAFHLAHCTSIDLERRCVVAEVDARISGGGTGVESFTLAYDHLVLACGATSNTFGIPGVQEHAFFLKEVQDARSIRRRIIDCFERAMEPGTSDAEKRQLLSFAVVGGGPTGVEFAGELYDFINEDVGRYYPVMKSTARISLFEATDKILGSFDATLSAYAAKRFARQGIVLHAGVPVQRVDKNMLILKNGEHHPFGLLVWSTGIGPNDLVKSLPIAKDRGKIVVDGHMHVLDAAGTRVPNVYALGDCVSIKDLALPATAQVASQQGAYLGKALSSAVRDRDAQPAPFSFKNYGVLAYLGGWNALADTPRDGVKVSGRGAWLLWRSAYFTMTVSWRNKILIPVYWFVTWIFGRDTSRL